MENPIRGSPGFGSHIQEVGGPFDGAPRAGQRPLGGLHRTPILKIKKKKTAQSFFSFPLSIAATDEQSTTCLTVAFNNINGLAESSSKELDQTQDVEASQRRSCAAGRRRSLQGEPRRRRWPRRRARSRMRRDSAIPRFAIAFARSHASRWHF